MATKKEMLAAEIARAVGAGKAANLPTVDFSDPNRPKTCLEVDFPVLPVNQVAIIEGNAGKPIYQMSKWWARRRSSVFRAMLIAAATKAPDDPMHAAKLVWDNYYANHQTKGAFKNLKVADIFMGGGTTLVEGSRLGMQMTGNDLNPVAWFVCKQELAKVDLDEVKRLLADIEAEVKPQIMPYYCCDGPNGEKGTWTHLPSRKVMPPDFDPLTIPWDKRKDYGYEGPEIIYTFWAKHGPCTTTGCGHRTPIMTSPVMAVKSMSVKYWEHKCKNCGTRFDIEDKVARMAPDVPLCVAPGEMPYAVLDKKRGAMCPGCRVMVVPPALKPKSKKIHLTLLVHPEWLKGCTSRDDNGRLYGGTAQDDAKATARWNEVRANSVRLLELRGKISVENEKGVLEQCLPDEVTCPVTQVTFSTTEGTVPRKSTFACQACGTEHDVLTSIKATNKTAPVAGYAIQGFSPSRSENNHPYNGRFFARFDYTLANQYSAAQREWECRREGDLADYWPRSELPYGFMTHHLQGGVPNHGLTHWWTMFNPRQLLTHSLVLKALATSRHRNYSDEAIQTVLATYSQCLRYHCALSIYQADYDKLIPHFSNNNFYPKMNYLEGSVFAATGAGTFDTVREWLESGTSWKLLPWELVSKSAIEKSGAKCALGITGKSEKVYPGDRMTGAKTLCHSSTDLANYDNSSIDLVITDPPFGGLLHYSELSDFFYVWLRLVMKDWYPEQFGSEYTPKSLEAVANKAREPEDPDGFYQRILTQCWREAHRILRPAGLLAFTFHHSEDEPWVAVLESLFDAGFYLEATYPIRSDETKGDGEFGSKKVEYDIIHVCRKRTEEPKPVSWGRMRREVKSDVRQLKALLENHAREGLPAADLQVIRRGKALEYFSKHYGKVYVDTGRVLSVKEALAGINELLEDEGQSVANPLPVVAEPITRHFLRIFRGTTDVPRDQMQKFLRGTGLAPDEFIERGWCTEKNRTYTLVPPLDFARLWHGKHKRRLTFDLDQALVLIGACYEGSGINAAATLENPDFHPHVALKPLIEWFAQTAASIDFKAAARKAVTILNLSPKFKTERAEQMNLFGEDMTA